MAQPEALLIVGPAVDFPLFVGATAQMLGYSPASSADSCPRDLTDAERFISCLACFKDKNAKPLLDAPHLLAHVYISVLVVADERDLVEILECASAMPFVTAETVIRGVQCAVVSGTLADWRNAVASGTQQSGPARACYCRIASLFEAAGLRLWQSYNRKPTPDSLFLLEYKGDK